MLHEIGGLLLYYILGRSQTFYPGPRERGPPANLVDLLCVLNHYCAPG
jgi:hypothetical protein